MYAPPAGHGQLKAPTDGVTLAPPGSGIPVDLSLGVRATRRSQAARDAHGIDLDGDNVYNPDSVIFLGYVCGYILNA